MTQTLFQTRAMGLFHNHRQALRARRLNLRPPGQVPQAAQALTAPRT